ncbi:hypothetical protein [uncultured Mediterranean phage uvDeep-CGR2-AD3-C191]|nr:hypothetical protein [uncultured Mediterranean phage uvDeep-CGR2-AD3-C191]
MNTPQTLKELFTKPEEAGAEMSIDVTQILFGYDGTKLPMTAENNGTPASCWTFRACASQALMMSKESDSGQDKYDAYLLVKKIENNDEVTLTSEQKALIKLKVGETFSAALVGPMWRAIDPGAYSDDAA